MNKEAKNNFDELREIDHFTRLMRPNRKLNEIKEQYPAQQNEQLNNITTLLNDVNYGELMNNVDELVEVIKQYKPLYNKLTATIIDKLSNK